MGIIAALLAVVAIVLYIVSPVVITIRNDSDQAVSGLVVNVQGRQLTFADLAPGRSSQQWFRNSGADAHYSFKGTRADSTRISVEGGNLKGRPFYGSVEFRIGPDGAVVFQESYN